MHDLIPLDDLRSCGWVISPYRPHAVTGEYPRCGKSAVAFHQSARKAVCQEHANAIRAAERSAAEFFSRRN